MACPRTPSSLAEPEFGSSSDGLLTCPQHELVVTLAWLTGSLPRVTQGNRDRLPAPSASPAPGASAPHSAAHPTPAFLPNVNKVTVSLYNPVVPVGISLDSASMGPFP